MLENENPIGIFDSGFGGITVLAEIQTLLPKENFIYFGDSKNAPYGNKYHNDVIKYSSSICDYLYSISCKVIVVACNTATSIAVKELRNKYPIPIIGMEPAVKPVAKHYKDIVVMATPNTLNEKKFIDLVSDLNIDNKIKKIPALELVDIVENQWDKHDQVQTLIRGYFSQLNIENVGAVVLGCTHFVFFKRIIEQIVGPDIEVVDGNSGTVNQLYRILVKNNLLCTRLQNGSVGFVNSDESKIQLAEKLLIFQKNKIQESI